MKRKKLKLSLEAWTWQSCQTCVLRLLTPLTCILLKANKPWSLQKTLSSSFSTASSKEPNIFFIKCEVQECVPASDNCSVVLLHHLDSKLFFSLALTFINSVSFLPLLPPFFFKRTCPIWQGNSHFWLSCVQIHKTSTNLGIVRVTTSRAFTILINPLKMLLKNELYHLCNWGHHLNFVFLDSCSFRTLLNRSIVNKTSVSALIDHVGRWRWPFCRPVSFCWFS